MKIKLLNTSVGLKPLFDEDFEEKKKLKIGEVYEATIKRPRNLSFHRKYFGLINLAWEYQNERAVEHFKHNIELFRKTVEMAAGWCEPVYSIDRKEWIEIPNPSLLIRWTKTNFKTYTDAYSGSRLCCGTFDDAEYIGKKFEDLYNDYFG